ncbi:putative methionyl-tRNA formyltransferase [Leptomonas pyrrhocoris]|uniref:Putative methionyl-tRNA formyltransferase n=1 Tax=Leptomonas pyrrhocoris TaxID=157538 RepID=A0A0N0VH10_LEPPY|nr:putative methionyl-tRNA formyltransferase [Leptomonas pyrrhocoris]XP_015663244.1 putative methionyl-tRNA formyltransferase [Leptomonas pyrrhocoris]KPA84804.1 putative methionyl-tRNA formyltransferase [Leptomonas pyrrhocoris]KPA84805.1 putative methionyl-tRNA formyltransferase [Leptomonas pyrrhocoris]|eukprot:XP_015663243.1 putative methionyl-tRNA formyltransferase [Leptomonas pyrrhocoris]
MRHRSFSFTAACPARRRVLRFAEAPPRRTCGPLTLRLSIRTYTAIPLSKVFLCRGACPHLAGNRETACTAAPPPCDVSSNAATATHNVCVCPAANDALLKQKQSHRFMQCRTTTHVPTLAYAASAVVEELRVCESVRQASRVACVRVPRLLVFGGDVVSVTALEALHARMRCIVSEALRCSRRSGFGRHTDSSSGSTSERQPGSSSSQVDAVGDINAEEEEAEVDAFVREHITVVCPALPKGITPEEAARKFTRQYPVARYCIDHGLPIIPVDHSKSLTRSTLLKEMLRTVQGTAAAATPGATTPPGTTATSSSHAGRPQRSAPLTHHLPSHVLSASRLVHRRHATFTAASKAADDATAGKYGIPGRGDGAVAEVPAPHTWAAQGRPLDDYDLAVVVSFRYFLPQQLLRVLPPVINMHPSLLPRYRGASPIFSALRHNEAVGGVSIIQMKPEQKAMDSGSILWQCEVPMTPDMDIRLYFPLVTQIGAAGLCDLIFGEAPASSGPSSSIARASRHTAAAVATSAMTAAECAGAAAAAAVLKRSRTHEMAVHLEEVITVKENSFHRTLPERDETYDGHSDDVAECHGARNSSKTPPADPHAHGSEETPFIPPWVALRRSSLMPVVHRSDGRATLLSPLHHRERLAPYADLPELSAFSSIITAQSTEMATEKGRTGGANSSAVGEEAQAGTATGGDHTDTPRPCRRWMTLCRGSTHITPEAVHEASNAHRALFFQNLESASAAASCGVGGAGGGKRKNVPVNKKQVSPAAAAELAVSTAMRCAEVFPKSVLSPHCDWPDSFTYSWKFAQQQEYGTFAHFTDDPFHAPLLPKDSAVLRFSAFTAMEAFGVWRAFVGGDYFQPSVNATLDKGSSPVRNQLVHRGVRRLLRERARAQKKKTSPPPQQQQNRQPRLDEAAVATLVATSADNETPVGIVVGKHIDLDVFNPVGLRLLAEAENMLRIPCTFTQVTNPTLVPPCVQEELAEVERGGDRCCGCRPSAPLSGRRVRFYRAPPAIFRSLLSTRAGASEDDEESVNTQRQSGAAAAAAAGKKTARVHGDAASDKAETNDGEAATEPKGRCSRNAARKSRLQRQQQQPDEPAEDEEAPDDYVPDVIHAAPPTEHRWHIPPGTGYFPESDESYGAIKCREGWFLWKEAHMKWANKAQPTVLIRKGLAMKTGVLYVGLFSEYS